MYSATWPKEVRKITGDLLVNPVQVNIGNANELAANMSITHGAHGCVEWYFRDHEIDAIMLIVGFLPGLKVTILPLLNQIQEPEALMIDEFVTDIREFSTSVSGCNSPAAIIVFGIMPCHQKPSLLVMLYLSSDVPVMLNLVLPLLLPWYLRYRRNSISCCIIKRIVTSRPHTTSVIEKTGVFTDIAARREGSVENINVETILNQVDDEFWDLFIGVTKKRKYSIAQEKVGCMTSLAFHPVLGHYEGYLRVHGGGLKTDDTFRFYYSDPTTALSSTTAVSSHLRSFNQGRNTTTGGDKQEVFGGLIFTCPDMFGILGPADINSSPFLDNFPGVTLGGNFCSNVIGRRVLTKFVKESQEQKEVQCCVHVNCSVYLIMSYTPLN
ncbi:hypothetical protein HanXRQr2_Chr02g0049841 [Helianthus annuus]|uniref:Uncharacterized protein n=1 Tax=Helianthus annuus TaxID=4232 RepID=A0A9K3JL87_HELAN|nr:hypothetical protein HanXRQr2_Chr02g0049841 [Helianthus annuus]